MIKSYGMSGMKSLLRITRLVLFSCKDIFQYFLSLIQLMVYFLYKINCV